MHRLKHLHDSTDKVNWKDLVDKVFKTEKNKMTENKKYIEDFTHIADIPCKYCGKNTVHLVGTTLLCSKCKMTHK